MLLTQEQRDKKLAELNALCMKCMDDKAKNFEHFDPKNCDRCKIGQAVHALDSPDWDSIDWNSSQWENLYRH